MRLFHVSEEENIEVFVPRTPTRQDLDPAVKLVWAIDEKRLPNFLTPRDCPRVTYHAGHLTTPEDRARFFSSRSCRHCVVIEREWFRRMWETTLYLYEFDPAGFWLQDEVAGYYVAEATQVPVAKHRMDDLFSALFDRNVELRVVDDLWELADQVIASSLNFSLCRMDNAKPRT